MPEAGLSCPAVETVECGRRHAEVRQQPAQLRLDIAQMKSGRMHIEVEGRTWVTVLADLEIHQRLGAARRSQRSHIHQQGRSARVAESADAFPYRCGVQAGQIVIARNGPATGIRRRPLPRQMQQDRAGRRVDAPRILQVDLEQQPIGSCLVTDMHDIGLPRMPLEQRAFVSREPDRPAGGAQPGGLDVREGYPRQQTLADQTARRQLEGSLHPLQRRSAQKFDQRRCADRNYRWKRTVHLIPAGIRPSEFARCRRTPNVPLAASTTLSTTTTFAR